MPSPIVPRTFLNTTHFLLSLFKTVDLTDCTVVMAITDPDSHEEIPQKINLKKLLKLSGTITAFCKKYRLHGHPSFPVNYLNLCCRTDGESQPYCTAVACGPMQLNKVGGCRIYLVFAVNRYFSLFFRRVPK